MICRMGEHLLSAQHCVTIQITVNGREDADMTALASYVEQSDALLGVLTVRETIGFAARLRSVVLETHYALGFDESLTGADQSGRVDAP